MRDVAWRIGLTLMALSFVAILGPNISCGLSNRLLEQVMGQTPQAQVGDYLTSIAAGDRAAALALWALPGSSQVDLQRRREAVTDELLAYGPSTDYRILDIEWWSTCCEPGVIEDPDEAGGACFRVAVSSEGHPEMVYVFDLLVPGGYWGAAMSHPVRDWTIVDVYPEGQVPLAWPWRW